MTDDSRATENANKQIVLAMWHKVIDGRDFAAARDYIAEDYVQHSPSAGQGLTALIDFLQNVEFPGQQPLPAGSYPLTRFEFVLAEGDLVQLMFRRPVPDPHDLSRTLHVWWFDTYRLRDGMIIEHWDSALE
jgi:predicted SnoaL-like aldol condensation-catalyzing enzyme